MSRQSRLGIVTVVVALIVIVLSVVGSPEQDEQLDTLLVTIPFALIVGVAVFALLIPWARSRASEPRRPARVGLVMSILGVVSVLAFWSGLPVILGTGGVALGRSGRGALGLLATIAGALAVAAGVAIFALDRFA